MSQPFTINTNFSTPINLTKLTNDESSPHFSPVFSPFPIIRTETTITPNVITKSDETTDEQTKSINSSTANAMGGIEFRLNKSSIDLTNVTSPRTTRKNIIIPDLNENGEPKERKYRFPDLHIASIRRRSSSANHFRNSLRID